MNSDTARPRLQPEQPDIQRLPNILKIEAARVNYHKPRTFCLNAHIETAFEGVQVDIYTDEEFAIRAAGPVLFVGKVPLIESERIGHKHYRFHSLGPMASFLKKGDLLHLEWASSSPTMHGDALLHRSKVKGIGTKKHRPGRAVSLKGITKETRKRASGMKLPEIDDRRS